MKEIVFKKSNCIVKLHTVGLGGEHVSERYAFHMPLTRKTCFHRQRNDGRTYAKSSGAEDVPKQEQESPAAVLALARVPPFGEENRRHVASAAPKQRKASGTHRIVSFLFN